MSLISPGPQGPPQGQVPEGCVLLALGCAQPCCSFLPIAPGSQARSVGVSDKLLSGLCVMVWTQPE